MTFFYLLELVIRGICHVEVHHSLGKFAGDPACVADGAVVALGLAAVFVRHAPYVSWGLALSKCARFLRAARSCARHLRGLRHARAATGRTYAVELDGGAVVGDVDRRDILTGPERRYVDMRRAAGDEVMAPRGFGAARARSGDDRETRGSRGRSEAPEPLGKWDHYARSIFIAQCVLCVFHFALVIALYVAVTPAMRLPTRWDPGDRGRPAHGLGEVFALALYLPVVLLTCFLLGLEVRQMLLEGSQNYFAGHAVWKALDLACLSLQLLVDGLLAMEVGGWLLAFFACVNVLFFNWRIISFARGFENWGPLVRMIVKIVWEVRFFSAVVALMLVGFWLAFAIGMQETPTEWLMVFLFNAGFYGEYEKDYLSGDQGFYDWRMDRQLPITTVLQLFMLIFGVLALNLLIAIMNSAYERVRASAVAEMLHEKSMIILSIERLWLPMVISAYGIPHDYFFPRWLLLLGPISILDVSEEKRRAMHDRVVGMRESLS